MPEGIAPCPARSGSAGRLQVSAAVRPLKANMPGRATTSWGTRSSAIWTRPAAGLEVGRSKTGRRACARSTCSRCCTTSSPSTKPTTGEASTICRSRRREAAGATRTTSTSAFSNPYSRRRRAARRPAPAPVPARRDAAQAKAHVRVGPHRDGPSPEVRQETAGHTDPKFTLRVYAHAMRFSDEDRARLKAIAFPVGAAGFEPATSRV
jgi:hypothetical protein